MKHKLFCTEYNSDNDSVVSYEDEDIVLITRKSEYIIVSDDTESGRERKRTVKRKGKKTKQKSKQTHEVSSDSETDYDTFHRLTSEEIVYYLQFVNTADNPSCQHPKAFTYLLNHYLIDPTTFIPKQYYLDTDGTGPDPNRVMRNALRRKRKDKFLLNQDTLTPPLHFQTEVQKGRNKDTQKLGKVTQECSHSDDKNLPLTYL